MPRYAQARYWILTIPCSTGWAPPDVCPEEIQCILGQKEVGADTGYEHWQVMVAFKTKVREAVLARLFPHGSHWEQTRSEAARKYVHKEDTAVAGTRFKLGEYAHQRGVAKDWDQVVQAAKKAEFNNIPGDVLVRYYGNIKRIAADHVRPQFRDGVRTVVYWGPTGTGKTYRAWQQAGRDAYPKDPNTKWWCGYAGQDAVIFDEYRGAINISHVLRWLDGYPCLVEPKGGVLALNATKFFFTSNLHPKDWYPDLDFDSTQAFLRRLEIIHVTSRDDQ